MTKRLTKKVGKDSDLNERVIAQAVAAYADYMPEPFKAVDSRVVEQALALAGGAWTRLVIESPTAVTVHNNPMW